MSKKHKRICTILDYLEHLIILASVVTGFLSVSAFSFQVPIVILTIWAITAGKGKLRKGKKIKE